MKNTISVIVPIYNTAEYLPRCVESLLAQDHKDMEILLIDDCSTDESEKLGRAYADQYDQIRFLKQAKNQGQSAARNRGIAEASGEWVAFVDSDDWVAPNYLSSLFEATQKDRAAIAVNTVRILATEGGKRRTVDYAPSVTTKTDNGRKVALLPFAPYQKLIDRKLAVNPLFPEDVRRFEDFCAFVPMFTKTQRIAVIHEPTYFYYQRNNSVSTSRAQRKSEVSCFSTAAMTVQGSVSEYRDALEFRIIYDCLYGLVSNMIRAGFGKREIKEEIDKLLPMALDWKSNPYRKEIPILKRIFLFFAYHKWIFPLPILVWAWDHIGKWLC